MFKVPAPWSIFCMLAVLTSSICPAESLPEQGVWRFNLSRNTPSASITKSLYKNSSVVITDINCPDSPDVFLRFFSSVLACAPDHFGIDFNTEVFQNLTAKKVNCQAVIYPMKYLTINDDGVIIFITDLFSTMEVNISVTVRMEGNHGFLSAVDWPLLPFYSTMCVIYALYGFFWMIICFCYWRDLLRIQLWIGAVIFLGLVEKSVFVAEYESINKSGKSVEGAVITADLVSCCRRTLSRMLIMVVSLGFGITKPRLGTMLHKVTALGCCYFILSSVYTIVCDIVPEADSSPTILAVLVPVALTDAIIWWWIFISLFGTIRYLILKKNAVKLSLYRHFRNIMILACLASILFMAWSFLNHKMTKCLTDWKEFWIDIAFWDMLFSMILLVIIILWRPSANNQRYAYSPQLDADDEENSNILYSAFGDVKKTRNIKSRPNNLSTDIEDENLKWIDDNIPTSVLDIQLPGLFDSDSELNQHQVQVSKME